MTESQTAVDLDPHWIERIHNAQGGEDFLGLRAVSTNILAYLLPGIITITPRARYYAFYSWCLAEYVQSHPSGWSLAHFMRRREQIFALANLAYRDEIPSDIDVDGLEGWRKLNSHWKEHRTGDVVPLTGPKVENYLNATYGGYSFYASVMRELDITHSPDVYSSAVDILPLGQKLADAYRHAVEGATYYDQRHEHDVAPSIPISVLRDYGQRCHISRLAASPDRDAVEEALFALDAPRVLSPNVDEPSRGNMRGSLGLLLDMVDQARVPLDDERFRRAITYGLCADYQPYPPAPALRPFVAHWRMFQLREYYVYAIYALWAYFLNWLKGKSPQPLNTFFGHLDAAVNLKAAAEDLGFELPARAASRWPLDEWFNTLLDSAGIPPGEFESRCQAYAEITGMPVNEDQAHSLYRQYVADAPDKAFAAAWLLLSTLYLRLRGLKGANPGAEWQWAKAGDARRRSMSLFAQDVTRHIEVGHTVLDAWMWLTRDYLIAQHTITALEKWRERGSNTFHFIYSDGLFEFVQPDWTGFSASRFDRAYTMLKDLDLISTDADANTACLTQRGRIALDNILESLREHA